MSQNAQTLHSEFENCPILELCPSEYNQFPCSDPHRRFLLYLFWSPLSGISTEAFFNTKRFRIQ
jgi:hypothetical protein